MFQGFSGFQVVRIVNIVVISERYWDTMKWHLNTPDIMATLIRKTSQFGFSMVFHPKHDILPGPRDPPDLRGARHGRAPGGWRRGERPLAAARGLVHCGGGDRLGWGDRDGGWGWGMSQIFLGRICGKDVSFVFFFLGEDVVGTGWNPKTSGYIHFRLY